jgi:NhaA family Na+:H+ antiporter
LLRLRNRHYRGVWEQETADADRDGVPDMYRSGRD